MDLIHSVAGTHCLGNHEDTPVGRLFQRLIHISDLEFLVADESMRALAYHAEAFLNGFFK